MVALPCAKEIIDSLSRLSGLISCARSSVALYGPEVSPSDDSSAKILRRTRKLESSIKEMLAELERQAL